MRRSTSISLGAWVLAAVISLAALVGGAAAGSGSPVAGQLGAAPPLTDPATLCVVAFNDADGDGERGLGEAGLSGWVVTVKDDGGVTVGAIATDALIPSCLNLLAGTYAVTETSQPSWQPTSAGHATQLVSLVSAQTTTVAFGNHRCCPTLTFRAGEADNFSLANGASAEPVTPVSVTATPAFFDATRGNRVLAQRFRLGTANCVQAATLRARMKPLPGDATNDTLTVRVPGGSSWAKRMAAVSPTGPWAYSSLRATAKTVVLDLGGLPSSGGSTSLVAALNAKHLLDVIVQDDTGVDYIRLVVTFRACQPG
jgi:hypothetical protein